MSDLSGILIDNLRLDGSMQPESYHLEGTLRSTGYLSGEIIAMRGPKGDKGDPGTTDYPYLENKPQIEGVELVGNKSFEDLGLIIDSELSSSSSNPIMNSAVYNAIDAITYTAGNGIQIVNKQITLDDLILDCGTSTTVI